MEIRFVLVCMALLTIGTACSVDTTGLRSERLLDVDAVPDTICLGDATELSWNPKDVPYSRDFCATPNASYGTPLLCTTTANCPPEVACIDGKCLGPDDDVEEIDFGSGCPADAVVSIDAIEVEGGRTESVGMSSDRIEGSRTHAPAKDTIYTFRYTVGDTTRTAGTKVVRVLEGDAIENLNFGTPACRDVAEPRNLRLGEYGTFDPSSSVILNEVRNRSAADIFVSTNDPPHPEVRLVLNVPSMDFNGTVPRRWTARFVVDGSTIPLPSADCVVADAYTPIPLVISLNLSCR